MKRVFILLAAVTMLAACGGASQTPVAKQPGSGNFSDKQVADTVNQCAYGTTNPQQTNTNSNSGSGNVVGVCTCEVKAFAGQFPYSDLQTNTFFSDMQKIQPQITACETSNGFGQGQSMVYMDEVQYIPDDQNQ